MSVDIYDEVNVDIDNDFYSGSGSESGIAGYEIAYGSANKTVFKKTVKSKYHVKQKLDSINERRSLDMQLNPFSNYWDS